MVCTPRISWKVLNTFGYSKSKIARLALIGLQELDGMKIHFTNFDYEKHDGTGD